MRYESFIAKRYIKSKHRINFIGIISALSTLGVTIGVASLIVVMSVFNGFGSLVKSLLVNFDPHLKVVILTDDNNSVLDFLTHGSQLKPYVQEVSPYVEGKVILLSDNTYEILKITGLDKNKPLNLSKLQKNIISGNGLLQSKNNLPPIILGRQTALKINRLVGDTVLATSFGNLENTLLTYSIPKSIEFGVTGIFSSTNNQYDANISFTDIATAQSLLGMGGSITGYSIILNNFEDAEKVKEIITESFPPDKISVYTWYDLHKDLYDVMQIERWAAFIILSLIILVAAFNIMTSLTMSVIEKRKDIAVVKTLGGTNKSISKIYLLQGFYIGLIGTISGIVIGLTVCYLQINYNFYPLDPMKYIIDALPVEIRISDIIIVSVISILLSVGAGIMPAKRTMKTSVTDAIKWE
jgi:lipoprotein-releasing system permease protein